MKFLSQVYTSVSGSIGGITYANNGGLIARSRATPANPNTLPQQDARAALGAAATAWAGLTDANRDEWNDYAGLTPLTGKLGQQFTPSGYMMFCRWAAARGLVGENIAQPSTLATSGTGPAPDGISAGVTATTVTVTFSPAADGAGDCFIQISAPLSAGRNSLRLPLTYDSESTVADTNTEVEITPAFTLVSGERRVIRSRIVYDDGRVSQPFSQIVTVAA